MMRTLTAFCAALAAVLLTGYVVFKSTGDLAWGLWSAVLFSSILMVAAGILGPRFQRWTTGTSLEETFTFPYLLRRARLLETGWRVAGPLLGIALAVGLAPSSMGLLSPEVKLTIGLILLGVAMLVMAGMAVAAYGFIRSPNH